MTSYVFTDKENHDNLYRYFQLWLDVTNSDPENKKTLARAAWCEYEATIINQLHNIEKPLEHAYKFNGTEKAEMAEYKSMYNALLVFGPLNEDSDYVVCRCGRVVLKKDHYRLKNPNADCCKICVNRYDEDMFSANKLFEMPTSLQTDFTDFEEIPPAPLDLTEPEQDPEQEPEQELELVSSPMSTPTSSTKQKRKYSPRRVCVECGGPNKNRKKQKCPQCLNKKN